MAIERTVETDVYCDVCGEWIMGWKSNDTGVSRAWAAEYTRRRGGTVGKMQKMHSLHILSMGRIVQRIEAETGRKPRPVTMAT